MCKDVVSATDTNGITGDSVGERVLDFVHGPRIGSEPPTLPSRSGSGSGSGSDDP